MMTMLIGVHSIPFNKAAWVSLGEPRQQHTGCTVGPFASFDP